MHLKNGQPLVIKAGSFGILKLINSNKVNTPKFRFVTTRLGRIFPEKVVKTFENLWKPVQSSILTLNSGI